MTPSNLTIKSTREALNRGDFSPEELIRHYENKIEKENKKLNALLTPFKPVDEQLKLPEGLLRGIPYALKDNILFENSLATAGSKILENYRASFDATVVKNQNQVQ